MSPSRPRTALVTTSWPRFDGDPSGHFVAADARARQEQGDDVVVIAAEGAAFGWPGVASRLSARPLRAASAGAWVARARQRVQRGRFDRVVAHWAIPCAWPIASGGSHALHVVSHGGDVRLLVRMPRALRAGIVGAVAARAGSWQFVADHLAEGLIEHLPRDVARAVERVARIEPCAVEVARPDARCIDAVRARAPGPFTVCAGRLVASKRVEAAIAWAARERATLVVVGDGPERGRLEDEARRAGARVRFVGRVPRPEALAWIAASERLVNASRIEGASTVEREARALGVPVVRV